MPLRRFFKNRENHKRSSALKGRPAWQDVVPKTSEGRKAYAIAAKHQSSFTRAYLKMVRELLPDRPTKRFVTLFNDGNLDLAMGEVPVLDNNSDAGNRFFSSMSRAYGKVIDESGMDAAQRVNRKFKTNMTFTMLQEPTEYREEVLKQEVYNPYSQQWVMDRVFNYMGNLLTTGQIELIKQIIKDSFAQGLSARRTYERIKANIGLTIREYDAVKRREQLHADSGFESTIAAGLLLNYQDTLVRQRAEKIARTETIKAEAIGRNHAWLMAKDQKKLPEEEALERVWLAPPPSPNPNRPCEICRDLDGKTAPIDGFFESEFLGLIEGAPAHPHCRCTETLEVKKSDE